MNQYPILPWILSNYSEITQDSLRFRKLKYPVSVQNEEKQKFIIRKYEEEKDEKFKVHFRCHYSTSAFICYYLLRLNPFTQIGIKLQTMKFDNSNRMFVNLKETCDILDKYTDNRELIPELYYQPEMFLNINCNNLGIRTSDSKRVNDVILPDKVSNFMDLIYQHRKYLECSEINTNIVYWIDNVFGATQLIKTKESLNVFNKECYESELNLSQKYQKYKQKYGYDKAFEKIRDKINTVLNFGQTPHPLFRSRHSKKITTQGKLFVRDDISKLSDFLAINKKYKFPAGIIYFNYSSSYLYLLNRDKEIEVVDKQSFKRKFKITPKTTLEFNMIDMNEGISVYKYKYLLTDLLDAKFFIIGRYLDHTLKIYEGETLVKEILCENVN
jgi:hypothetical protein